MVWSGRWAGQGAKFDRRTTLERELSLIATYEKNLVDAIAKGQTMDPLLAKLRAEETRKKDLIRELEQLDNAGDIGLLDDARFKRELKSRLANIRRLLQRHVSSARGLLKTLLEHPLRCPSMAHGRTSRGHWHQKRAV